MRKLIVAALFALAACRGEPVPRDYQNAPPDVGNAAQSKTDTPAAHGMGDATPQPSTGNEGTAMTTDTTATTMSDTPPTTTTT
ncbi:MAG TPA: hypothetical protein VNI54_18040 [Thermoanaerobaculia bacterium]|nr:hypothetical protein [Thermoanaerobaculia bacterium]